MKKQHAFRTLIADAMIDPKRPSAGYVRFCPNADEEFQFEMPVAAFRQLRDQISAALEQVETRARPR